MDFHEKESFSASTSEICTSLYIGDVEIVIDNPCEEEIDSFEDSMLVHNVVPSFFLEDCRATTNGKTIIIVIKFAEKAYRANAKYALHDLSCETPPNACDGSGVIWNPSDYSGIPLAQAGEFHLDCMVRYAHQFSFIPHTYDLTMFLMAHKGGLDKILHRSLWYDVLPSSEDEFKSCRSPTLFPPDGCIQKHESKTWLIWIPMVISVAQWSQ
jgi:hypothetical protein